VIDTMVTHPRLLRQMAELGLDITTPPADQIAWQRLLGLVEQSYTLAEPLNRHDRLTVGEITDPVARRQMSAALRTLLNHLSHDLRTPLAVLNSYLQLTRHKLKEGSVEAGYLQIAQEQSIRIARIVDDITTFSSLEFATDPFEFRRVNLNEVLNEVLVQQARPARAKQLAIEAVFAAELPDLPGDRLWLAQMIKNLLNNAIQYTEPHGCIRMVTAADGGWVALEITDTGVGIPAADLPHIFDQFFRSATHRPLNDGGAGLGLTIAKKIVEAHHGEITVTSEVGRGTTVYVRLPCNPEALHTEPA
jgi:signal transduction histidine kinase